MSRAETSTRSMESQDDARNVATMLQMLNWLEQQALDLDAPRAARMIRQSIAVLRDETQREPG